MKFYSLIVTQIADVTTRTYNLACIYNMLFLINFSIQYDFNENIINY